MAPMLVDALQAILPFIILFDIKMSGADSFVVLSHLLSQPRLHDIPAIVMSSSNARGEHDLTLGLGASEYWPNASRFDETVDFIGTLRRFVSKA